MMNPAKTFQGIQSLATDGFFNLYADNTSRKSIYEISSNYLRRGRTLDALNYFRALSRRRKASINPTRAKSERALTPAP
jgi:hypothetical protein